LPCTGQWNVGVGSAASGADVVFATGAAAGGAGGVCATGAAAGGAGVVFATGAAAGGADVVFATGAAAGEAGGVCATGAAAGLTAAIFGPEREREGCGFAVAALRLRFATFKAALFFFLAATGGGTRSCLARGAEWPFAATPTGERVGPAISAGGAPPPISEGGRGIDSGPAPTLTLANEVCDGPPCDAPLRGRVDAVVSTRLTSPLQPATQATRNTAATALGRKHDPVNPAAESMAHSLTTAAMNSAILQPDA